MSNPSEKTTLFWLVLGAGLAVLAVILAASCNDHWRVVVLGFYALIAFAASAVYMGRKRLFLSRLGSLHAWMIGHVVLGGLVLICVILHAGFTDIGAQGLILYALTIVEIGSGLWGLYELRATPRRFRQFAQNDFMYPSAVRTRIAVLRSDLERTLETREKLRPWFEERYGPALRGETSDVPECEDYPKGTRRHASNLHETAAEVIRLSALKLKIDAVDRKSRRWLWVHVPASVAFVVFVSIHVAAWLYYG